MNIFNWMKDEIKAVLENMAVQEGWPEGLPFDRITAEPPRDASHGDIATNAAMVLAKPVGAKPRAIAEPLAEALKGLDAVDSVEVAGPGFINIRLSPSVWQTQVAKMLEAGTAYGSSAMGAGRKVNVEYVSANPTGPLHAAHARGAVFGDALAALLEKAGFEVAREYYINDAGAQVDTLARSTYLRYREALGETVTIPDGHYPGEYLKDVGKAIAEQDGDKWLSEPEDAWLEPMRSFAIKLMMADIEKDLIALGIRMDRFSSERALVEDRAVDRVLAKLEADGLVYTGVLEPPKGKTPDDWEPRPQLLFKATQFGDDVDRPLKKSDGSWTYFSNDIAYHLDKLERGFPEMIDVWGADHGGYVKRMKAAVTAITGGKGDLDVKLCQLVHLFDGGKPVRMSKRAGTFVTLADVLEAVGPDVLRFIMLTRRNDQTLEFDYQKVSEQSRDNPVFYVQYAHARACSVIRNAGETFDAETLSDAALAKASMGSLTDPDEIGLIKLLAGWPRVVESAAEAHEPHRVAFYLGDVAAAFHGLWNKGREDARLRFILEDDCDTTLARMALVRATATVVASGLGVMGVTPVEELRE
ncbi:arginine--tRNA ligase [Thalassobaculum sp. OXR-137]|uniref:arginine--tRNA ligase n=1 Tax=Thalassobaculum sp. OXR-137 TaxID=3100173 RepID=UPI002AC8A212|nr:arginine--tRNA ligase [Thalassobaculum sp. OXR-137]WPZ32972.1 arginine--tRNA ligase [Thalassobaculum sp. OXR-137]